MKNNKGITLTSLVIYIAVVFVVIAAITRITTHFSNNMKDAADVAFETEFQKINLYLLDETKKSGNAILEISADSTQVTFSKGNKYTYHAQEKRIYLNDTIKVCEGVESCLFEEKTADNGKSILSLKIKINGTEKTVDYVMKAKNISQKPLLSDEYQQVEYIESTGTQYIDTGFIPNSNTSIEMKASNTSTTNACLYCARGTSGYQDSTYTAFLINGTSLRVDYYNTAYDNLITAVRDTQYIYKQYKNLVYIDGKLVKTLPEANFSSKYNMYLLASHRGEAELTNIGKVKLNYCKIWDGDTLVRDFIPCYRKSDNVVGMYDLVNDVFYTNAGTGEFEKGSNVIIASENEDYINEEDYIIGKDGFEFLYQQVEYIESTGTQYIDTGLKLNQDSKVELEFKITEAGDYNVFGSRTSASENNFGIIFSNTYQEIDVDFQNYTTNRLSISNDISRKIYKISNEGLYIGDIKKTVTSYENFTTPENAYIFNMSGNPPDIEIAKMKLYYCKIWDGDTLVRDFIPCYQKSDNVAGLYDLVNDVFYTNAGTGNFTVGAEV